MKTSLPYKKGDDRYRKDGVPFCGTVTPADTLRWQEQALHNFRVNHPDCEILDYDPKKQYREDSYYGDPVNIRFTFEGIRFTGEFSFDTGFTPYLRLQGAEGKKSETKVPSQEYIDYCECPAFDEAFTIVEGEYPLIVKLLVINGETHWAEFYRVTVKATDKKKCTSNFCGMKNYKDNPDFDKAQTKDFPAERVKV